MSTQQPGPAMPDQGTATPTGGNTSLDVLLAERDALCGDLSARQVEFAKTVTEQAGEIGRLRGALTEAKASLEERYGEIARLSKLVLELEAAAAAQRGELARSTADAREREASQASERAALQARLEALQRDLEAIQRERDTLERERVLARHGSALRLAELAMVREALGRQQALAASAQATLRQIGATRAWRAGRFLFREGEIQVPADDTPAFDHLEYQKRVLSRSDLFDADWYLATYPEVAEGGLDPAEHYLRLGSVAGYDPGPRFDTVAYLRRYRDVCESGMNPLVHYLEHGQAESRDPGHAPAGATGGAQGTSCS